jgi:hypothetical protein
LAELGSQQNRMDGVIHARRTVIKPTVSATRAAKAVAIGPTNDSVSNQPLSALVQR